MPLPCSFWGFVYCYHFIKFNFWKCSCICKTICACILTIRCTLKIKLLVNEEIINTLKLTQKMSSMTWKVKKNMVPWRNVLTIFNIFFAGRNPLTLFSRTSIYSKKISGNYNSSNVSWVKLKMRVLKRLWKLEETSFCDNSGTKSKHIVFCYGPYLWCW